MPPVCPASRQPRPSLRCGPGCHKNLPVIRHEHVSSVASRPVFAYLYGMEVHLTPEQQAQLAQIATQAGTAPERLVTNVVARYLDKEVRFLAAVEKGIAAAERGEFIEEEEMDARLEAIFKP